MDYEKKYNEALEKARKRVATEPQDHTDAILKDIFPELRESEDERIRKLLVWQVYRNIEDETNDLAQSVYDGIKGHDPDLEESIEDWKKCLAYLEKQKEPENTSASTMAPSCWEVEQKEQKPAEWSEEDERKRLACIETINEVIDYERERWEDYNPGKPYRPIMKYDEQVDWLKSLRPSWKPSEHQMNILKAVKEYVGRGSGYWGEGLGSLIEDLKKL